MRTFLLFPTLNGDLATCFELFKKAATKTEIRRDGTLLYCLPDNDDILNVVMHPLEDDPIKVLSSRPDPEFRVSSLLLLVNADDILRTNFWGSMIIKQEEVDKIRETCSKIVDWLAQYSFTRYEKEQKRRDRAPDKIMIMITGYEKISKDLVYRVKQQEEIRKAFSGKQLATDYIKAGLIVFCERKENGEFMERSIDSLREVVISTTNCEFNTR